ncbi:MAG TPA: hypothetical protein VJ768_11585 [Anaerolineales bacterium]|nr:hypothetical protein [Anaerolineales bacterium]
MRLFKAILLSALVLLGVAAAAGMWVRFGWAADEPERKVEIIVPIIQTEWWIVNWDTNAIECSLLVEHDELPKPNEVIYTCGQDVYLKWAFTPLCTIPQDPSGSEPPCEGLYVYQASKRQAEKTISVDLPLPSVLLTISGCTLIPPENLCNEIPDLVFAGHEPLPNEQITVIHIRMEEEEIDCPGEVCEIPMPVTTLDGIEIEFWAESSFGDSSPVYKALIRMVDAGVSEVPGETLWYVDVLSTQWVGGEVASCSQVWESLQPVGGPPLWLSTPAEPAELASAQPYAYLAGRLISTGQVDASSCADGGLLENGNASTCGELVAQDAVIEWQNQFDPAILEIARDTNVPAVLLKNQFAVESQFWPGILLPVEYGFGQITDGGADATLLWNEAFFAEFCPLILEEDACSEGYLSLDREMQAILRGALASGTDASCPTCEIGIDLTHAEVTIDVFANTLLGNCEQTGRIIRNTTGEAPGALASYEDLWRFTLVNYNAGPGCLSNAILSAWRLDRVLDWSHVAARLSPGCSLAVSYVEQVEAIRSLDGEGQPPATATPLPPPTAAPIATPTQPGAPYPAPGVTPPYP